MSSLSDKLKSLYHSKKRLSIEMANNGLVDESKNLSIDHVYRIINAEQIPLDNKYITRGDVELNVPTSISIIKNNTFAHYNSVTLNYNHKLEIEPLAFNGTPRVVLNGVEYLFDSEIVDYTGKVELIEDPNVYGGYKLNIYGNKGWSPDDVIGSVLNYLLSDDMWEVGMSLYDGTGVYERWFQGCTYENNYLRDAIILEDMDYHLRCKMQVDIYYGAISRWGSPVTGYIVSCRNIDYSQQGCTYVCSLDITAMCEGHSGNIYRMNNIETVSLYSKYDSDNSLINELDDSYSIFPPMYTEGIHTIYNKDFGSRKLNNLYYTCLLKPFITVPENYIKVIVDDEPNVTIQLSYGDYSVNSDYLYINDPTDVVCKMSYNGTTLTKRYKVEGKVIEHVKWYKYNLTINPDVESNIYITSGNNTYNTDSIGAVEGQTLSYKVEAEGYKTVTGNITMNCSKEINIQMAANNYETLILDISDEDNILNKNLRNIGFTESGGFLQYDGDTLYTASVLTPSQIGNHNIKSVSLSQTIVNIGKNNWTSGSRYFGPSQDLEWEVGYDYKICYVYISRVYGSLAQVEASRANFRNQCNGTFSIDDIPDDNNNPLSIRFDNSSTNGNMFDDHNSLIIKDLRVTYNKATPIIEIVDVEE